MSDDVIKVGNGILNQIKKSNFENKIDPFWYCNKKHTTVIVSEVADYSLFVKKNLSNVRGVRIKTKSMDSWLTAKEIIATPSGGILYFEDKVKGIFKKGYIYPIIMYTPLNREEFLSECLKKLCTI